MNAPYIIAFTQENNILAPLTVPCPLMPPAFKFEVHESWKQQH